MTIMSVHPYLGCPVFSSRGRFSAAILVLLEKTETVWGRIAGSFPRTTAGNRRSANILWKKPLDVTHWLPQNI